MDRCFHPDAETHDLAVIPDAPVRRGHEALREWVVMMEDIWVDARYEPEELDVPTFHVFEVQDGKIRRFWSYLDRAEALEAVGLRDG
jgi:hypothetical protein